MKEIKYIVIDRLLNPWLKLLTQKEVQLLCSNRMRKQY